MKSIRVRLLVYILGVFIISAAIVIFISYKESAHEIEEVFDSELAQTARLISQLNLANIDSKGEEIAVPIIQQSPGHKYESHISYQVWYDNALVLRSASAPLVPLSSQSGYSTNTIHNTMWRVFALYPEKSHYRIYTAEDFTARNELTWEIVTESLEVYFWSTPILALLIYFSLTQGLKSLTRLSEAVREKNVYKLDPIKNTAVPVEVQPIVTALNELLSRIDSIFIKQRRFTSNASHELRTPLSGIKLHAQIALSSSDIDLQKHTLEQILIAVDHSTHLVDQLLTLSRLDENQHDTNTELVNIPNECQSIIASLSHEIERHHAHIDVVSRVADISLVINKNIFRIILINLIMNAMIHNVEPVTITLVISEDNEAVTISLVDSGQGIPEQELGNVLDRFYRLSGQETAGSGLGLSIVKEAADRLGCTFILQNSRQPDEGLQATFTFLK